MGSNPTASAKILGRNVAVLFYFLLVYVSGGYGPDDAHRPRSLIASYSYLGACEKDRPKDTEHIKFECVDQFEAERKMDHIH